MDLENITLNKSIHHVVSNSVYMKFPEKKKKTYPQRQEVDWWFPENASKCNKVTACGYRVSLGVMKMF